MNKALLAGVLVLLTGVTVAAGTGQTQQIQQNQNGTLNSVYAYDSQGNFFGMIFTGDSAATLGTPGNLSQLDAQSAMACRHSAEVNTGVLGGILNGVSSDVSCANLDLQQDSNESMMNDSMTSQTQTRDRIQLLPDEENETQSQVNISTMFYAKDTQGDYIAMTVDDQNMTVQTRGTVDSVDQLENNSLLACEYMLQQGEEGVSCYDSAEFQNQMNQGAFSYLGMTDQQPEMNQTQNETNMTNESMNQSNDSDILPEPL